MVVEYWISTFKKKVNQNIYTQKGIRDYRPNYKSQNYEAFRAKYSTSSFSRGGWQRFVRSQKPITMKERKLFNQTSSKYNPEKMCKQTID